jgi:hypothetical protein
MERHSREWRRTRLRLSPRRSEPAAVKRESSNEGHDHGPSCSFAVIRGETGLARYLEEIRRFPMLKHSFACWAKPPLAGNEPAERGNSSAHDLNLTGYVDSC